MPQYFHNSLYYLNGDWRLFKKQFWEYEIFPILFPPKLFIMDYEYSSSLSAETLMTILFISLAFSIFLIAAQWRVFTKAGQPGWAALIPIYNVYIMTKIAGKPGIWTLLMFIPIVNIIFAIWLLNMVSKSFGHDEGFTVGLLFLGIIFWPILGFGKSKYQGPYGNPEEFRRYQEKNKFDFENKG
jgi:hypothetical protein